MQPKTIRLNNNKNCLYYTTRADATLRTYSNHTRSTSLRQNAEPFANAQTQNQIERSNDRPHAIDCETPRGRRVNDGRP